MQVAVAQLDAHLAKGLRSLYTLHGDETLLVQEAADLIRATARSQGYTERSVFTVAGAHFDWGEVLAAGGSMSLFADRQIIEVRIPSGKPGKDGSAALQQLADAARGNDSVLTLVLLPRLDKMTRGSAWFSALEGRRCRNGLRSVCRNSSNACCPAKKASVPCNFLPIGLKATCWPPTRRFKNSACCTPQES